MASPCTLRDGSKHSKVPSLTQSQAESLTLSNFVSATLSQQLCLSNFVSATCVTLRHIASHCVTLHLAHCPLHIAHCTLPIAHCTLHIAHCPLHIAHCTLPIAHCVIRCVTLPIADLDCPLPIAHCVRGGSESLNESRRRRGLGKATLHCFF